MTEARLFAGRYRLLDKIGEGGMAEIFAAQPVGPGVGSRQVAIKRIRPALVASERAVELFLGEARVAMNLEHPNIVRILDLGKAEGTYFLVMERIPGHDLQAICQRGIAQGSFLPLRHGLAIAQQVAAGLAHAHAMTDEAGHPLGIVHQDVSPTNILVTPHGVAKLVDFGIARAAGQAPGLQAAVAGKLSYMAPEQVRGEPVDARSDLYSLGIVLYEITVGRRLFRGPAEEVIERLKVSDVPRPSEVRPGFPAGVEAVLLRLLAARPGDRYADAGALGADLEDLLAEPGLRSGPRAIARYLTDLYGETEAAIEVEDDTVEPDHDDEDDSLDFDARPPMVEVDPDFAPDPLVPPPLAAPAPAPEPAPEPEPVPVPVPAPAPPPRTWLLLTGILLLLGALIALALTLTGRW